MNHTKLSLSEFRNELESIVTDIKKGYGSRYPVNPIHILLTTILNNHEYMSVRISSQFVLATIEEAIRTYNLSSEIDFLTHYNKILSECYR